jgi:hypothetical protein
MSNNNFGPLFETCTANVLETHLGQYMCVFFVYVDSTCWYMLNLTMEVLSGEYFFFISTVQKVVWGFKHVPTCTV